MNDKYLNFILSVIAIGILGINVNLWSASLFSEVHAANNQTEVTVVSSKYHPIYVKEVK
jgi:hypothetical protein